MDNMIYVDYELWMLCSSCFSLVCSGHGRRLLVFTTLFFLKIH